MNFPTLFPVTCHTQHVGPGSTFVAIKGQKLDGIEYIQQAVQQGATRIVIQQDVQLPLELEQYLKQHSVELVKVADTRKALAELSAQALSYPANKLTIIGVTGTKGKTTSTFVLEQVLRAAGIKTGLLSSVHNVIDGQILPTQLTTPQPDYLHVFFDECVKRGVTHVVMEVAAQAFSLYRVHGLVFHSMLFTNFDATHAEFYATVQDYFAAKCRLFDQLAPGATVFLNIDNAWCKSLVGTYPHIRTLSVESSADFTATITANVGDAISFDLKYAGGRFLVECPTFIGRFSVYNLMGVVALALNLGIDAQTIVRALAQCPMVPGRLERYPLPNGATCIVDYAHNPISFESILSTLRPLTHKLIVVFGCGGDRDATMRPLMGTIATEYADMVILTTDNPRSEKVETIIEQIMEGISPELRAQTEVILDRQTAIEKAVGYSDSGAIIALLGKGRDEYQHIGAQKTYFSEVGIVQSLQKAALK